MIGNHVGGDVGGHRGSILHGKLFDEHRALGTVLANNLCRAGIGHLVIADRDYIELNNLQRQILFDEDDITRRLPKAIAAAEKLRRINSDTIIEPLVEDINADGIESLVQDTDLVLDATDNFETRYLLNDVCVKYARPWIYSGVIASYGVTMNMCLVIRPAYVASSLRYLYLAPRQPVIQREY